MSNRLGIVFFALRASRGSKVLKEVLGERYDGTIICDRFSAYLKYHKDRACGLVHYCWAHILRQAKGLPEVLGCGSGELFSRLVRRRVGALFRVRRAFKEGRMSRAHFIAKAEVHMGLLKELLEQNVDSPSKPVRTFCEGQLGKWASLFTFVPACRVAKQTGITRAWSPRTTWPSERFAPVWRRARSAMARAARPGKCCGRAARRGKCCGRAY